MNKYTMQMNLYLWVTCLKQPIFVLPLGDPSLKEINSQTDLYLVNLSSKTYAFEDKLTKY